MQTDIVHMLSSTSMRRQKILSGLVLSWVLALGPAFGNSFKPEHIFGPQRLLGADSAYSVKLSSGEVLWLFGDTFVGKKFVHNSAVLDCQSRLQFLNYPFLKDEGKDFYWPGDGIAIGDKLYIFAHKVRIDQKQPAPFHFKLLTDDLFEISNLKARPEKWKIRKIALNNDSSKGLLGVALVKQDRFIYMFYSSPTVENGVKTNQTRLCRFKIDRIPTLKTQDLESVNQLKFFDGASEMTVREISKYGHLKYIAVYVPDNSQKIVIRYSHKLDSDWSEPKVIFDCRNETRNNKLFCYSAKAHPEYVDNKGRMLFSYCVNAKDEKYLLKHPEIYRPRFFWQELKKQESPDMMELDYRGNADARSD